MIRFKQKKLLRSTYLATTGSFFILLSLGTMASESAAQTTPLATLEWEAESSRPAGYTGRALASPGTRVAVTLLPVSAAPLGTLQPEWLLDGAAVSAPDPLTIRFVVTRDPGVGHTVLARVRNVKTQAVEELTLLVPVVRPEVLLYDLDTNEWPRPHAVEDTFSFPKGTARTLLARSYFLPGTAPAFRWLKNGQAIVGAPKNPDMLLISAAATAAPGSREYIQAIAQHPQFPGLAAMKEIIVEIR